MASQSFLQQLKSKGYTDEQIQSLFSGFAPTQAKPKKSLADFAPLIGGLIGSVALPGLGTVLGGALGSAAGAGAKQLIKKEDVNFGEIAKEGALGLAGGVVGKGLGAGAKLLGAGSKTAAQTGGKNLASSLGLSLQKANVRPTVPVGPFAAEGEESIIRGLADLGLKGTPEQIRRQVPTVMRTLSSQIDDVLSKTNTTISKTSVKKSLNKALADSLEFDETIPGFATARDKFFNQLGKSGTKNLTAKELFDFKQKLGTQLKKAFDIQAKGGQLNPSQSTGLAIWESIDDILTKKVPAVKQLTLQQSTLFKASPGLKKAADEVFRLPIFGTAVPGASAAGKAVAGVAGRGLEAAGSRLGAQLDPLTQLGITGAGQGAVRPGLFSEEQPEEPMGMGFELPLEEAPQQQSMLSEQDLMEIIAIDIEASGGKNIKTIMQLAQQFNGSMQPELDADQKKQLRASETAINIVDQIESQLAGVGLSEGVVAGRTTGTIKNLLNTNEVRAYNALREGLLARLLRALGEVGTLSDGDIKRAEKLVPKVTDTQREAALKLQNLRELIGSQVEGVTSIGGGAGGQADILAQIGI